MGKTMAVLSQDVVTNVIWCADNDRETDYKKDPEGRLINIGDTYSDGKWYRDGVEILTPLEQAQKELADLQSQIADMDAALSEIESALGVNT